MTIRTKSHFAERLREAREKARPHVKARAEQLSGIAKELHRNAPRSGTNLNRFGEPRSAPGEAPAMETGELFAKIDQGVTLDGTTAQVVVNYSVLEHGTVRMKPRPLGRQASDELRKRVKDEP